MEAFETLSKVHLSPVHYNLFHNINEINAIDVTLQSMQRNNEL